MQFVGVDIGGTFTDLLAYPPRRVQKLTGEEFPPGTTIVYHTAGGGGFGDPLTREPAAVLRDVVQGYISPASARDDYGVVLSADLRAVDREGTAALRAGLGGERA